MRILSFIMVVALAAFPALRAQAASEMEERKAIIAATLASFQKEDFAELERVSTEYRQKRSRLPSGVWKLYWFNAGLTSARNDIPKENFEAAFTALEEKTRRWTRQFPKSAAGHIAYSQVLIAHGWAYRGSGYASTVKPEAWKPFRQYLALARANLEKNKKVASVDPTWYVTMSEIATAQSWGTVEFDKMLNEGLEREPLAYEIYFTALRYMTPKWGGSLERFDEFARMAVKRTQKKEGQSLYARIYWSAACCEFKNDLIKNSKVDWPTMKAGFEDIIARYPDPWNIANYAKFSCYAQDKPATRQVFDRPDFKDVPEAWPNESLKNHCKGWSHQ